jgi:opacity protein-like surface antigen
MDLKPYLGPTLAALIVCSASSVLAQTAPAAMQGNIPLSIGAGISGYNPNDGHGHLLGGTLWIDYTLPHMPHILQGIGLEAEARDLNYGRSTTEPADLREDTAAGGVIYSWPRYRYFRPYAKVMAGYGNADEETLAAPFVRWHDSRTITSGGGGIEYRVYRSIWVRVDYEYQSWPDFYKHPSYGVPPVYPPAGRLNPQGFTVGAMYHFSHPHYH